VWPGGGGAGVQEREVIGEDMQNERNVSSFLLTLITNDNTV
jgi:hypothetical protein